MYSHVVLPTAGALAFLSSFFVGTVFFDQPFLVVHGIKYADGNVITDRTITENVVADWRVTIVPSDRDGPACNTIPGPKMHEGWSPYGVSERAEKLFPLDIWVGDPGCSERLEVGKEHQMYMTWTPRDGSEPVSRQITFKP